MAIITGLLDKNLFINLFRRKLSTFQLNTNDFIAFLCRIDSTQFFLSGWQNKSQNMQQNC